MSISILNRGASGGLKPELIVTAPAGSTIDLIQNSIIVDTYTLGAEETEHTFVVKLGTYTVQGTLGEDTKSVEVVIDAVGQYDVEIGYNLWLYREGDECEDVTGGFVGKAIQISSDGYAGAVPTITRDLSSITCSSSGNGGVMVTANLIDLTPFSKLIFSGTVTDPYSTAGWHNIVGVNDNTQYFLSAPLGYGLGVGTFENVEIDVSNVNQPLYVGIATYSGPSTTTITMTKLRLE